MRVYLTIAAVVATAGAAYGFHPLPPAEHTHARAGCPQAVAKWAVPSCTDKYALGYVGGGCLGGKGERRVPHEGVFGSDYVGCGWYPGRVFLNWCHCAKQPKPGPYKT